MERCYEFKKFYKKPGRKNLQNGKESSVYLDYLMKSDYNERSKIYYKNLYLSHYYERSAKDLDGA
jgi:hypothetical protein